MGDMKTEDTSNAPTLAGESVLGLWRHTDPDTSKDAALSVDAAKLMDRIYAAMKLFGDAGCIADDVERALPDVVSHSITPRFRQMLDRGMIEYTGEKRTGKCGRKQMVRRVLPPPFQKPAPTTTKRKMVLPERRTCHCFAEEYESGCVDGWNACLDEIAKLN